MKREACESESSFQTLLILNFINDYKLGEDRSFRYGLLMSKDY